MVNKYLGRYKRYLMLSGALLIASTAKLLIAYPSSSQSAESTVQAYIFPNPILESSVPTLHIANPPSEKMTAVIFDISGRQVYRAEVEESELALSESGHAIEKKLDSDLFQSGIYIGVLLSSKNGSESTLDRFRFTVIK